MAKKFNQKPESFYSFAKRKLEGCDVIVRFIGGSVRQGRVVKYEPHKPQAWIDWGNGEEELLLGAVIGISPVNGERELSGNTETRRKQYGATR